MRNAASRACFALGILLAAAIPALAQPLISHSDSLETTVANSDLLFVAKLVKFDIEEPVKDGDARHATIAIEENLKREPFNDDPYVGLQVDLPYPAAVLADWQKRSSRLLVAYRDDAPQSTRVIELEAGKVEVLLADFTLLRDPDAAIEAARKIVRRQPAAVKRLHTFHLNVPREKIIGTRWEQYHGHTLSVLVDETLERRAVAALKSKLYQDRAEAARALRFFKSDENTVRVRKLLSDSGWAYLYHAQENNGVEVRIYGVRYAAYRTLKAWGEEVEEPMIREEVPQ
jgi:hypothetical protein